MFLDLQRFFLFFFWTISNPLSLLRVAIGKLNAKFFAFKPASCKSLALVEVGTTQTKLGKIQTTLNV